MSDFRLYASRAGEGSWSRVAHGCEAGLRQHGRLAGFVDLAARGRDGGTDPVGYDAPVGLALGAPPSWSQPFQLGKHEHRLALVAPNSTWVPALLGTLCLHERLTCVIAPSRWAQDVLRAELPDTPVWLWQHGIDTEAFYPNAEATAALADRFLLKQYTPGFGVAPSFDVLHLASSPGQRKGTLELLDAWALLVRSGLFGVDKFQESRLTVVAPPLVAGVSLAARVEQLGIGASVDLRTRVDGSTATMREFYQRFHLVCQPSRGEGFGWCPLEALACGVPIVATDCTGHADHVGGRASVVVPYGEPAPCDDGPGAMLPTVRAEDIATALSSARTNWLTLARAAMDEAHDVRKRWSWAATTASFLERWDAR